MRLGSASTLSGAKEMRELKRSEQKLSMKRGVMGMENLKVFVSCDKGLYGGEEGGRGESE
jgi:hypothetical protein